MNLVNIKEMHLELNFNGDKMEKTFKQYLTVPIVIIIVLLALSFGVMWPVFNMVLLGAILAFLIRPLACKIQKKIKYSSLSIIIAIVLVIIPLILLCIYILFVIVGVTTDFISTNFSSTDFDLNQTSKIIASYLSINNPSISILNYINSIMHEAGKFIVDYIVNLAKQIPDISIQLFILICSFFYFTRDGHKAYKFIEELIPDKHISFFHNTVEAIKNVLNSIFYGHFLTALIIGIIAAIGYSLLGYPYGVFLGILTGIFQLLPVIGPWPIYWALFFMDLINGNYINAIVVLLFGFGLSLSDLYIRPILSSHYADIPPLILLIGFLAGPLVFGIVGFITGPLILGITYAVLVSYKNEKEEVEG